MIKRANELRKDIKTLFDGKGDVQILHILDTDQFNGKGRLFARLTLAPGSSVGFHQHNNDFETYFITKGEGIVNDNGTITRVTTGDVVYTPNGEGHSIENDASSITDLEFIALILFNS
jgi:mannose-6-phosphate isomerase-like protein (cupin superfamily)